jgi:hypothetical protein
MGTFEGKPQTDFDYFYHNFFVLIYWDIFSSLRDLQIANLILVTQIFIPSSERWIPSRANIILTGEPKLFREEFSQIRSEQMNYGKSNQKQSEVHPQMYPYQPGFMSQSPQIIWLICNPQVLNMVATNYFSQICLGMLKHNMILKYTHVYETSKNLNN